MKVHKNARLTPIGRERMVMMVLRGQTPQAVSKAVGACPRTVRKWIKRYEEEGAAGLLGRRSRPQRLYRPTPPARRPRGSGNPVARSGFRLRRTVPA